MLPHPAHLFGEIWYSILPDTSIFLKSSTTLWSLGMGFTVAQDKEMVEIPASSSLLRPEWGIGIHVNYTPSKSKQAITHQEPYAIDICHHICIDFLHFIMDPTCDSASVRSDIVCMMNVFNNQNRGPLWGLSWLIGLLFIATWCSTRPQNHASNGHMVACTH